MNKLKALHKHCSHHRKELEASDFCWCFYCRTRYSTSLIKEWVDNKQTAICPMCGIDAVLGNKCGTKLTNTLIGQMYKEWFCKGTIYNPVDGTTSPVPNKEVEKAFIKGTQ